MKIPNLDAVKCAFLLEWTEEWKDGAGCDHIHVVYEDYETAMEAAHGVLAEVFPEDDQNSCRRIFDHARENNEHYCGGVSLKPVPYFPKKP